MMRFSPSKAADWLGMVSVEGWLIILVVLMLTIARFAMIEKMDKVQWTLERGVWKLHGDGTIRLVIEKETP